MDKEFVLPSGLNGIPVLPVATLKLRDTLLDRDRKKINKINQKKGGKRG